MRTTLLLTLLIFICLIGWWLLPSFSEPTEPVVVVTDPLLETPVAEVTTEAKDIILTSPQSYEVIASPVTIKGEARGTWFFDASVPVVLTNWDGLIIAEGYATAVGDWMTEDFVPFTSTLEFVSPYQPSDPSFMSRGFLILKKDNPSGLPEYDDALELPVRF